MISKNSGSEKIVEVEGVAPFYFWGLVPGENVIDLSDEFKSRGVHYPSMVKIERATSISSFLYTVLTLGLFVPEDYLISVYSKGEEH